MGPLMLRLLAPVLALALAMGVHFESLTHASPEQAAPFHRRARQAVESIPISISGWEGMEVKVPPAATALLRPNAELSRRYENTALRRRAHMIVIQCRDTRDMSGHYPPNCYPGSGWRLQGLPGALDLEVGGMTLPMAVYEFARSDFERAGHIVIYNFFVIPARGLVREMRELQDHATNARTRPYGAAQVQIIFDAGVPQHERRAALRTLLEPLPPVLEALQLKHEGEP